MGGKSKGDDRNEKMIRYLLKLPENRRCINCNSLGPQYVCTTFWTFICTNCSGVHREFTHRVKSVSMAKFSDEEVNALQAGGNERARQTYLKTWDSGCNTLPRNSNINKLREFIKHVYEERRYTGDINRFSRLALSEKDDLYIHKYSERYNISKRHDDKNDRLFREGRNARSLRENPRHGHSPSEDSSIEVVDDKNRERNDQLLRRSATEMFTTDDLAQDKCSSVHHDSRVLSSIPVSRSIQDILGGNAPTIRVAKQPQAKRGISPNTSSIIVEKVVSPKKETSRSEASTNSEALIDLTTQSNPPLESTGDHGDEKDVALEVPHNNTLEYLLFELAYPTSIDNMPSTSNELALCDHDIGSTSNTPPKSAPIHLLENNFSTMSNVALVPIESAHVVSNSPFSPTWMTQNTIQESAHPMSTLSSSNGVGEIEQCGNLALVPTTSTRSLAQPIDPFEVAKNQPKTLNHNGQESQSNLVRQLTDFAHEDIQGVANSTQRKEIPSDLFNSFSSPGLSAPFPMWANGSYNNMGYSMHMQHQNQYPSSSVQGPTFANPPRSTNPFDMNNHLSQGQPNTFPSMAVVQGSLGNNMTYPQGAYMGQSFYNNTPTSRLQSQGNFGDKGATESLGSIGLNQQATYIQFAPTNPSPPQSRAGNPFA